MLHNIWTDPYSPYRLRQQPGRGNDQHNRVHEFVIHPNIFRQGLFVSLIGLIIYTINIQDNLESDARIGPWGCECKYRTLGMQMRASGPWECECEHSPRWCECAHRAPGMCIRTYYYNYASFFSKMYILNKDLLLIGRTNNSTLILMITIDTCIHTCTKGMGLTYRPMPLQIFSGSHTQRHARTHTYIL